MHTELFMFLLQTTCLLCQISKSDKKPVSYVQTKPSAKYDNPGFVRDRAKDTIVKQQMPEAWVNRFKKPFNPAWMDYCDPYHCNDYHDRACGLNRANMRFQWFQSVCHLVLNNQCATYRGFMKYDVIPQHFCHIYVMYLRLGCPSTCRDEDLDPICASNVNNRNVVLFPNQCSMDAYNCKTNGIERYDKVDMTMCEYYLSFA